MDCDDVTGAIAAFRKLVTSPAPQLDRSALTMASVLRPGLDVERSLADLDAIAASCTGLGRDALVDRLFRTQRFAGDRATYSDWRNSCLDHVIDTGRGIPITLSVVLIEVARRCGVELVGVGMPAHFLVGDPADPEWFVDAFDSGAVLDRAGCEALLHEVTRGQVAWHDAHLDHTTDPAILARMLNNLRGCFEQRNDRVRLAIVTRMRMAVPGVREKRTDALRALAVLN